MRRVLSVLFLLSLPCSSLISQTPDTPPRGGLNLGINGYGLSFGNSHQWNGIRINWRDKHVDYVNGLNITLWKADENENARYNGISIGTGPVGGEFNGITIGLLGAVADKHMRGISVGTLGLVSNGDMAGINLSGLGTVANGSMRGINIAGLGVVTQREMWGINLGGLGTVSQGSIKGISVGGLGLVAERDMIGINLGGMGTVAQGDLLGISVGGLGTVATGAIGGIAIGGLGVVGTGGITGVAVGGLGVVSTGEAFRGVGIALGGVEAPCGIYGITVTGFRARAKYGELRGLIISAITNRAEGLKGAAIGGYNDIRGIQRGLTIGLFNSTDELHGVQVGLLNRARNNRSPFKVLPILNLHLN